jgi:hypothetical protein
MIDCGAYQYELLHHLINDHNTFSHQLLHH